MDNVFTDENGQSQLSAPPEPFVSYPPFFPPEFSPNTKLTQYQKKLVTNYLLHEHFETEGMNIVVELDINIQRERDEPSLGYLKREFDEAQCDLSIHRDEKRKADRQIRAEEERLRKVLRETRVDEERGLARKQLDEIEAVLKRDQKIECLR